MNHRPKVFTAYRQLRGPSVFFRAGTRPVLSAALGIVFFSITLFVVPAVHAQRFDASGTLTLDGTSWSPANLEMGGSSGSVSQDFTLSGGNSGSIYEGPPPDNIEFTIYDDPDAIYSAPSNWQHNSANGLWQNHNIYGPHTGYSTTNNYGYEPGTYLRWNPGTTSGDLDVSLDYFNSDNDNGGFAFRFTDLDNMYWFDSDKQENDSRLYKKVNGASVSNVGNMTLGERGDVSVASGSSLSAGGVVSGWARAARARLTLPMAAV